MMYTPVNPHLTVYIWYVRGSTLHGHIKIRVVFFLLLLFFFYFFFRFFLDKNRTCGGVLFDPVGKIESQDNDGDGLYDDYAICGWVIVAPVDRFIKINFTNVDIEPSPPKCSYDRVQVRLTII